MPQANATADLTGHGLRAGSSVRLALTAPRSRHWPLRLARSGTFRGWYFPGDWHVLARSED
eukprot:6183819-Prymnesium_polylepis.1